MAGHLALLLSACRHAGIVCVDGRENEKIITAKAEELIAERFADLGRRLQIAKRLLPRKRIRSIHDRRRRRIAPFCGELDCLRRVIRKQVLLVGGEGRKEAARQQAKESILFRISQVLEGE